MNNLKFDNERKQKELIKCPLCGYEFQEGTKTACSACPLNYSKCHFEKCPNCGYDVPQGSFIWTALEKIWRKIKGEKG